MILCIDSGNSRIKWALHAAGAWREAAALDRGEAAGMADLPRRLHFLRRGAVRDTHQNIGQVVFDRELHLAAF